MQGDTLYFFRCLTECGQFPTNEETFKSFLTILDRKRIERKVGEGAVGALIEFDTKCPRCAPKGASAGTVRVLWVKPENDADGE